jgi:hypothetical protein
MAGYKAENGIYKYNKEEPKTGEIRQKDFKQGSHSWQQSNLISSGTNAHAVTDMLMSNSLATKCLITNQQICIAASTNIQTDGTVRSVISTTATFNFLSDLHTIS